MFPRRVIKLGGSLLGRRDLTWHLSQWLEQDARAREGSVETLVVVGGGKLMDTIRAIDRIRPGDSATVHWLCVELLSTTTRLVHDWFPDWHLISTPRQLAQAMQHGFSTTVPTLVMVTSFYTPQHDGGLPTNWDTTTDAIAALLACVVNADELILLKSCEVDPHADIDELAAAGMVDQAIGQLADQVQRIRVQRLPAD